MQSLSTNPQIQRAASVIKNANYVIITAGAGMGVDSGLPDFRGKDGFWNTYKSFKGKYTFYDCASPDFLRRHPYLFWGFYGHRLDIYRKVNPHYGFEILKKICNIPTIKDHFVVTSNVDGQFQKAGFLDTKIHEVHGSIHHMQCGNCQKIFSATPFTVNYDPETFEAKDPLPECPNCVNVIIRPNVLMFGDWDWYSSRSDQQEERFQEFFYDARKSNSFVIIEIGAGLAVPTIRSIGEGMVYRNANGHLIRINCRDLDTTYSFSSEKKEKQYIPIGMTALEALKGIEKELFSNEKSE